MKTAEENIDQELIFFIFVCSINSLKFYHKLLQL